MTLYVPHIATWAETLTYLAIVIGCFLLSIRVLRALPKEPPTEVLRRLYDSERD